MTKEEKKEEEHAEATAAAAEAAPAEEEKKEEISEKKRGRKAAAPAAATSPTKGKKKEEEEKKEEEPKKKKAEEKKKKEEEESGDDDDEESDDEETGKYWEASEGKRQRKSIEVFQVVEEKQKTVTVGEGSGIPLSQVPHAEHVISNAIKRKGQVDPVTLAHRLLFACVDEVKVMKENLLQFNGLCGPKVDKDKARISQLLNKKTIAELKDYCDIFGLEKGGKKDQLVSSLSSFIEKPFETSKSVKKSSLPVAVPGSGQAKTPAKKSSSSSATKKTASDSKKTKVKRAPTAYILFSNATRESIQKEFPDLKMTDIAKKLGEKWNGLTAAEKKPFEEQAAEAKAKLDAKKEGGGGAAAAPKAKAKAAPKKKKKDESSEEESEEEESEESSEEEEEEEESDSDADFGSSKKKRKAKKGKPAAKKRRTSRKKAGDDDDDDDEEEEKDDEEMADAKEEKKEEDEESKKLRAAVQDIVKGVDLTKMTMKNVKAQLKEKGFSVDDSKKDLISKIVTEELERAA